MTYMIYVSRGKNKNNPEFLVVGDWEGWISEIESRGEADFGEWGIAEEISFVYWTCCSHPGEGVHDRAGKQGCEILRPGKQRDKPATALELTGLRHRTGPRHFPMPFVRLPLILTFYLLILTKHTFLFLLRSRIECTWTIAWKKQMPNIICLHFCPSIFSSKYEGVISVKARLIFARKPFGGSLVTWFRWNTHVRVTLQICLISE